MELRIPLVVGRGGCFTPPAMKPVFCLVPVVALVTACDRNENGATSSSSPPKAIVVEDEAPATAVAGAPRAILIAEPEVADAWEAKIARAVTVSSSRVERVGEKTKEAAVAAEEHTREAIEITKERTEVGLRSAADSTGRFLQRAGEKIEEAAEEAGAP